MRFTIFAIPLATCVTLAAAVDQSMDFFDVPKCDTSNGGTKRTTDVPLDNTCVSLGQPGALSYDTNAIDIYCNLYGDQACQTSCVDDGTEVGASTCKDLSDSCIAGSIQCLKETSCC